MHGITLLHFAFAHNILKVSSENFYRPQHSDNEMCIRDRRSHSSEYLPLWKLIFVFIGYEEYVSHKVESNNISSNAVRLD